MNKIVGKDESNPDKNNLTGYQEEKILCPHCKRTATNGIKCKGICVADSDY
ncbi:MAG: hypothetical protein RLZZ29_223 [Cyanobacteriota bacterium]|jgi:hypothetical protein|uniref:hypothetical protein n=1 Tax=Cylindrospermopsis raciborskii TaxID=77022 RepID=UPI001454CFF8|nr:hypothetical protein [Cylindrospermopsis raciborskii]MBG0744751.1 hypothetical protein [Cylindrospermopsis raciborskii KL1]